MDRKRIGVYQIVCTNNNRRYIGASINLANRKRQHFYNLRHKNHRNPKLQKDFNLYGEDNFFFSILEVLPDKKKLLEREQYWIDLFIPEYNAELKAGYAVSHVKHPKVRKKISKSVKNLWENPEYRANFSAKNKGRVSNRKGVKLSEETKEKIRQANLGENNPNYGKSKSQEFINKISKTYSGAVSPDGIVYAPITNMAKFCRNHNLDNGAMSKLMNEKQKSYKGWKKYKG